MVNVKVNNLILMVEFFLELTKICVIKLLSRFPKEKKVVENCDL